MAETDLPWPNNEHAPDEASEKKVGCLMRAVFPKQPAGITVHPTRTSVAGLAKLKQSDNDAPARRIILPDSTQASDTPSSSTLPTLQAAWEEQTTSAHTASNELLKAMSTALTNLTDELSSQKTTTSQLKEELRQTKQRLRHLETAPTPAQNLPNPAPGPAPGLPGPEEWARWQQRVTDLERSSRTLQDAHNRQQRLFASLLTTPSGSGSGDARGETPSPLPSTWRDGDKK
jgi:hypothetical protein